MKKLLLVTLLLVFVAMPFTVCGTALAEDEGKIYYYTSNEIPVYATSDGGTPIFYIPATYAYQFNTEVTGKDYINITYNGREGYIGKTYHNSTHAIKLDWQNSYYYSIDFNITATGNIDVYSDNTMTSAIPYAASSTKINKVYSYLKANDAYYFYVNYTYATLPAMDGYIKVSDTSLSGFTSASVPQNPYYVEETTPETPSGDNPAGENPDGLQEPTNNLERYLLIAVIAVLCVVIVVLVFLPNKNRKSN